MTDEFFAVHEEIHAPADEFGSPRDDVFRSSSEFFDDVALNGDKIKKERKERSSFRRIMLYASCSLVLTVAVTTAVTGSYIWGGYSSEDSGYEYEHEHEEEYDYELDDDYYYKYDDEQIIDDGHDHNDPFEGHGSIFDDNGKD